jgi:bacillithiol synthase
MEMLNLTLPATNRFASEYMEQSPDILQFFHYQYQDAQSYEERLVELNNRSFYRKELAQHMKRYMEPFPSSQQVKKSFQKLKHEDSVVVIGGQQAGIITGPLYTIHKVISIIVLAQQKERELGVPVVPVFWIAGEDHDYIEVNHIYSEKNNKLEKFTYPGAVDGKKMISDISINKQECFTWVKQIIEMYGETEHTNGILEFVNEAIEQSNSMVDFFSHIIMELFKDFGLLIIDSGDKQLRKLEQGFLLRQLKEFRKITKSVFNQQQKQSKAGFNRTLEINENAVNIFYYDELSQSRILLEYDAETETFLGKNEALKFSFEQLFKLVNEQPEKFSNNVVTRPLMQEWLFPTLAFIAGPGEIAYWSELKQVFEHFEMKMPPIVPRLNITLLERSIETDLNDLGFSVEEVIRDGIESQKINYINSVMDQELMNLFEQMKQDLKTKYKVIAKKTAEIDKVLNPLVEKNERLIQKQIEFIEQKITGAVEQKHTVTLKKMERVKNSLRPNNSPQERILNPMYFLNKYGLDLAKRLTTLNYQFDGTHKVIKL